MNGNGASPDGNALRVSAGGNPMDPWIARKIGLPDGAPLTRAALDAYQAEKLRETLRHVRANSPFYAERLAGFDVDREIRAIRDLEKLPFVYPDDLRERGNALLCVPAGEVSRVVTLDTTGSSAAPKRVFFTEDDQELTRDFFHHGMKNLTDARDVLLILLPCERPGSVGDLLAEGLRRGGTRTIRHGAIPRNDASRDAEVLARIRREGVTALVGGPVEIARLARADADAGQGVRSVLLSTEYVSEANRAAIENAWDCKVFEHYGATEFGLGGAVACAVREGYHPREADLVFEVTDAAGRVLPDGEWGELTFTTLTRRAMPFIRYRIGDAGRFLTEPCPCGSPLRRLDRVGARSATKNRP